MEYSSQFLAAWDKFPHYKTRSKKVASYQLWAKLGLDNAPNVLAWIDLYEPGGYGACGFQVFIKGRDFEEPPRARAVPDKAQDPLKPLRTAAIKAGVEQGLDPARVSVAAYELCYDGDVFVPGVTVEAVLARAAGGG